MHFCPGPARSCPYGDGDLKCRDAQVDNVGEFKKNEED